MTTSSSSPTKVSVNLPPLIVMSMKPKKTCSNNNNSNRSRKNSSSNIDENYDNGFIDLTKQNIGSCSNNNNNHHNSNNLEIEVLRKKILKTTNTSNNKIINHIQTKHKNNSFRSTNNPNLLSAEEAQLLNKLKSLNICSHKNEINSTNSSTSASYKYEDIIKRNLKFNINVKTTTTINNQNNNITATAATTNSSNSQNTPKKSSNNQTTNTSTDLILPDIQFLIEKENNASNLIYLIRSKTHSSIQSSSSNFNINKDQVVVKSTQPTQQIDILIHQYKNLERNMTFHHEKMKDLLADTADTTMTSKLVEYNSNTSVTPTYLNSNTLNTSTNTASSKTSNFDPYLKYELISASTEPGDFGKTSLVLSRSNQSKKYVMKIIDLPEFKAISDSTHLDTQYHHHHHHQHHHHHHNNSKTLIFNSHNNNNNSSSVTPDQAEFNNLIELNRLKAIEYERLVKFLKELLQHSIKNTNLIRLIDTFTTRDLKSAYIVMDYCQDDSLLIRIQQNRTRKTFIANDLIMKWFAESIEGINYLHEHGILHANLKPSNFLIDVRENIKLADFGYLYFHCSATPSPKTNLKSTATATAAHEEMTSNLMEQNRLFYLSKLINGSNENYLPRETIQLFEYSSLSEVYCLAAVFFELIFIEKRYKWSEETLKNELKLKCIDENFAYLLAAMLNNTVSYRPNSAMINSFTEWQRCLDVDNKAIAKTLFSTTNLSIWKSSSFFNSSSQADFITSTEGSPTKIRRFVLKQIKLDNLNRHLVNNILPKLAGNLMHSNILSMSKFILIDCRLLVLNDFISNGSLKEKIERQIELSISEDDSRQQQPLQSLQYFKEEIITQWLLQIANGLEYLHSKSILNGNLKCENIMFNKANKIKLTDFGFYHLLTDHETQFVYNQGSSYLAPEMTLSKGKQVTTKSDIFMFGVCLYKCMSLKDYNHKETSYLVKSSDLKQHIFANEYSKTMKQIVLDMLHDDPSFRPTLKIILNELKILVNVNCTKFVTTTPQCSVINSRVKTFFCRDTDDKLNDILIVAVNQSNLPKMFFATKRFDEFGRKPLYCATNHLNQQQTYVEKFRTTQYDELYSSFRISLIKNEFFNAAGANKAKNKHTENDIASVSTGLEDLSMAMMNDFTVKLEATECLPQLICLIENNYIIGSDSEFFYLIDDHLKYVKNVMLIDALETVRTANGSVLSSIRGKRGNMIDLINLKLRVKALCYDMPNKKIYQLVTIQNQHCILNVFELEFSVTKTVSNSLSLNKTATESIVFNIYLNGKFHLSTVTADGSKVLQCTDTYLYICEREKSIRAFCKENTQYVHTVRSTQQTNNQNQPQLPQQQQPQQQYALQTNQQQPPPLPTQGNENKLQDFCVDFHGNMYVAYSYSIEAYNPKGEFIWTHDFNNNASLKSKNSPKSLLVKEIELSESPSPSKSVQSNSNNSNNNNHTIQGKIIRITVNKSGLLALITQDDKDEYKNRLYIYP